MLNKEQNDEVLTPCTMPGHISFGSGSGNNYHNWTQPAPSNGGFWQAMVSNTNDGVALYCQGNFIDVLTKLEQGSCAPYQAVKLSAGDTSYGFSACLVVVGGCGDSPSENE